MCRGTKEFLSWYGFAYVDHSLTEPKAREELKALARGRRGIPLILFNGETWIGFDRRRLKQRLGLW
ncbi:MAG: glutaredoxin family protein [Firmicutes bacterium]|nr:glutaredoxin family protein [Bacillota bacterium]